MSRDWHDPAGMLAAGPGALVARAWATWPDAGIPATPGVVARAGWFVPGAVAFVVVRARAGGFHTLYAAERLPPNPPARCVHLTCGWADPAETDVVLARWGQRFARDGRRAVGYEAPVVFFDDAPARRQRAPERPA